MEGLEGGPLFQGGDSHELLRDESPARWGF
jgi:hypothetical protein